MRISDWSSDVCSSDLNWLEVQRLFADDLAGRRGACSNSIFALLLAIGFDLLGQLRNRYVIAGNGRQLLRYPLRGACVNVVAYLEHGESGRSEEHTSELQSLMRISYAVFCLKKK